MNNIQALVAVLVAGPAIAAAVIATMTLLSRCTESTVVCLAVPYLVGVALAFAAAAGIGAL